MRIALEMSPTQVRLMAVTLISLVGAWLAWSVFQVNIEFDDGYATLTNARFRLGLSEHFYSNRAPLMALLMVPAEVLKNSLGLHPMDVRVAHALTALLHLAYLIGTWFLLVRVHGRDLCALLAYAAALTTPVFFSYAPFLSHDLFPGILALWMVYLADRHLQAPRLRHWMLLVVLGTILAMIKQTFALVWLAIVILTPMLLLLQRAKSDQWRAAAGLFAAAATSGIITWFAYGAALAPGFGNEPLWLRPWLQISLVSSNYASEGGAWAAFYPWVYVQNLWAYGILTMMLIVPGLALAIWKGTQLERLVALFWLFMVLCLHLTPYKEVRYLAFLAPFNAVLLVPILRRVWQERAFYRGVVLSVTAIGLALSAAEAQRIRDSYYAHVISDFLEPLPIHDAFQGRLIIGAPLSFVSPEGQAYYGDRYHRITHLTLNPIVSAYGYRTGHYLQLDHVRNINASVVRPGDIGLLASGALGRVEPFVRGNRQGLASDFVQVLGVAEIITLQREPGGYRVTGNHDGDTYVVLATSEDTLPSLLSNGHLDESDARRLFAWVELPAQVEVIAFRVLRRCNLGGCTRSGPSSTAGDSHSP